MDQGATDSSSASSGSSRSTITVEEYKHQIKLIDRVWMTCEMMQDTLNAKRTELTRILHPAWNGDGRPPEDAELNNLFLESETALQEVLSHLGRVEPEAMTLEWMQTIEISMNSLKQLAQELEVKLELLIDTLRGLHPAAARNLIRLLLERNP